MGDPAPDRNIDHYNIGRINYSLSSNEVRLTFCESYEVDWVCTQPSRRHPSGIVQYIRKASHSLRRQSRGNRNHGFSTNITSYEEHSDHHLRIFVANGDVDIKHVDIKEQIVDIFTKPLDSDFFRISTLEY